LDAFVHLVQPLELTFGYDENHSSSCIHFFETYIGAAMLAFTLGYITENSVLSIVQEAKSDFLQIVANSKLLPRKRDIFKKKSAITFDEAYGLSQLNKDIELLNTVIPHNKQDLLVLE